VCYRTRRACNILSCVGGYYLYTSGGNTTEARRKAEHDARYAREKTLDGAERVGDKIDNAYDDVSKKLESKYKDAKGEFKKEYGKEKDQIGKQVEVQPTPIPPCMSEVSLCSVDYRDGLINLMARLKSWLISPRKVYRIGGSRLRETV
jgi:beta-xylosidase